MKEREKKMKGRKNMVRSTKSQMEFFICRLLLSQCSATGDTNLLLRETVTAQTLHHMKPNSAVSKAEEHFI
jgi:hypothetical protein